MDECRVRRCHRATAASGGNATLFALRSVKVRQGTTASLVSATSPTDRTLLLIVADGVRPDVLARRMAQGHLPNLAARTARGGAYEVSSVFPSVTGPAYAPFLMGRFPAQVGIPGLRWYDRGRERCRFPPFARSYSGPEIWWLDHDLDPSHPTLLELATPSVAGASMLGRGARGRRHPGRGVSWMLKAVAPHFRGDLDAWRRLEGQVSNVILDHLRRDRPRFAVMAFLLPDKFAHKFGPDTPQVHASLGDLDAFVGNATDIARRNGWEDRLDLWVVADHGHATVTRHDDIADAVRDSGWRVLAHPTTWVRRPQVAVMVGGNAMGHVYVDLDKRARPWRLQLTEWQGLESLLLSRESVDFVATAEGPHRVRVHTRGRGDALVLREGDGAAARFSYRCEGGDPLGMGGDLVALDAQTAHDAAARSDYPDALVQLAAIVPSPRAGDFILSATPGWDFRDRFEPTPHVSTHGALHREHMTVPLLVDRPLARTPRRTADVMPSALAALGIPFRGALDGVDCVTP